MFLYKQKEIKEMHFSFTFRMQIGLFVEKLLSSSYAIAEGVYWEKNTCFMQFIVCLKGSMHKSNLEPSNQ